jgi:hypothetical protein
MIPIGELRVFISQIQCESDATGRGSTVLIEVVRYAQDLGIPDRVLGYEISRLKLLDVRL